MLGILSFWKVGAQALYDKLCIYKVLFSIYMLADVLHDLDVLNKVFQKETLDVTLFSTSFEVTLSSLRRKLLSYEFAKDTLYLKDILESTKAGLLHHTNDEGVEYVHELEYTYMPGRDKHGALLDSARGNLDACKTMAKYFVQQVIDCVNDQFPNMYFFNASKLFSPQYYPSKEKE